MRNKKPKLVKKSFLAALNDVDFDHRMIFAKHRHSIVVYVYTKLKSQGYRNPS
jgi:hypothetical protein